MKYVLVALMARILGPMAGYTQQRPVKVLSITNGQQLLVEVGTMVALFVWPVFRRLVFVRNPGQSLLNRFWKARLNVAIRPYLSFDQGMCMGVWLDACL